MKAPGQQLMAFNSARPSGAWLFCTCGKLQMVEAKLEAAERSKFWADLGAGRMAYC